MKKTRHHKHGSQGDQPAHETSVGAEDEAAARPEGEGSSQVEEPASAGATSEIEALKARLADKDKEISQIRDQYLRALADTQNTRKRLQKQSQETIRLEREGFLRELLPMVDDLERAVEAARGGGNGKPIVEGVEMVLRAMHEFLRSRGVTPLSSVGEAFDPARHEAVAQVTSEEHPPNTVVAEYHRGYRIGERMLRAAKVSVAKQPENARGRKPEDDSDVSGGEHE